MVYSQFVKGKEDFKPETSKKIKYDTTFSLCYIMSLLNTNLLPHYHSLKNKRIN